MPAALKAVDLASFAGHLQRTSRAIGGDDTHPEDWRNEITLQINRVVVLLLTRQSDSVTASMASVGKPSPKKRRA